MRDTLINEQAHESEPTTAATQSPVYRVWMAVLVLIITIAVPVLLVLSSVRLVMTPMFLQFEYNRPGFPADVYGFTTADRLEYAPYAVEYLLNGEGIEYLGELTFPDGRPLYNSRELRHMEDVKIVTRAAFFLLFFGGIGFIGLVLYMSAHRLRRMTLLRGLLQGALLTLSIVAFIVFAAVVAWDLFFTAFHQLFFEDGTWRFLYSDTLIRLFPEQFWFDAALVIGAMTVLGAILIAALSYRGLRNSRMRGS